MVSTEPLVFKKEVTCNELVCGLHQECLELFPAVCRCVDGYLVEPATKVKRGGFSLTYINGPVHLSEVDRFLDH